ncbi:MAG: SDR family NAD(P)-dependent oxidoreductase [Chloroflexi bacterium]|nr:SDR family NAD(P)-dependent oxidoreductase [Chloroflexota bacterium]
MKEFKDKVAVVTGAASGIGRGMAERFASAGMKVVLADVELPALAGVEARIIDKDGAALAIATDVSKPADIERLADRTLSAFGAVHVLCNNAGVFMPGRPSWEWTLADWEWVLGVNLWGVIHGIRVFVPIMLGQDSEGHIVNTASIMGLVTGSSDATYGVSKHGVVRLSECLHHELAAIGAKLKVSVLCPGWVSTELADADRNRPSNAPTQGDDPQIEARRVSVRQALKGAGQTPEHVAECVMDAIVNEKFYIITHPEWKDRIRARMDDILEERNPRVQPAPTG